MARSTSRTTSATRSASGVWRPATHSSSSLKKTNGVAERFFRTMKEQIIHGRIYRTVAEVREAVDTFVDLYNDQWLPEKNGFMSPSATREAWYARQAQEVAA